MTKTAHSQPPAFYLLLFLLIFLAIGGFYGGVLLVWDPSGGTLQMPAGALGNAPFQDYLIPGLTLLVFNGILPLLVAYGMIRRPEWRWAERLNLYPERHWSWAFALYNGIILAIWINVQLIMVGSGSLLQPIYGLWGLALIIATLTPGIMRYYTRS